MVKEKYLVVLGGSPRGGEKAWSSMYKYVKNHLKADLAICTGKKWLNNQGFLVYWLLLFFLPFFDL